MWTIKDSPKHLTEVLMQVSNALISVPFAGGETCMIMRLKFSFAFASVNNPDLLSINSQFGTKSS